MALANRIEPAQAQSALVQWLMERLPDAEDVRVSDIAVPTASGYSC
jgi:hypothetical protein